ncbi:glycerophosphodiester phosphodiesterase family protein [Hymenobacter sp. UYP22]|uniref:glycerophosphodiester phosphodiesterase n=1 Tax=Hymenobacter sp. UYP22 TaxID=3156348 RepID=UPI003395894F
MPRFPLASTCPLARLLGAILLAIGSPGPGIAAGPPPVPAGPAPVVIGHAGSGFFHFFNSLPPSSLRSIERALHRGADGVEVDVRLSQDSIPVLYHDNSLATMTTGQGCVSQTPAAALTQLRYQGGWPHDWVQHEKLQTLETVLQRLRQEPVFPYVHLDLHEDDDCNHNDEVRSRALARCLRRLLIAYQVPPQKVLILTTRASTLGYLRQLLPQVPLGYEMNNDFAADVATLQQLPQVQVAVLHKDRITPERAAVIHGLGRQLVVFGGRSARAVGRVVASGPEAYEVDNVRQLRATLRRQKRLPDTTP